MARELRSSKAKAAAPQEKPAPVKKSASVKTAKTPKTEKRKAVEDASPVATKKVKATKPKKVVEEVEEEEEVEKVVAPKKSKAKGKKAAPEPEPEAMDEDKDEEEAPAPAAPTPKSALKKTKASPAAPKTNGTPVSAKKTKAASKKATPAKEVEQDDGEDEEAAPASDDDEPEDEENLDDETKALVQTFQDSDDDNNNEEEEPTKNGTYKKGQDVGKIPKQKKAPKTAAPAIKGKPGVVYLGRIPHGFYEHQIRAYFSQFGPISNLRVARNKKTGASRHFAFIEFEEAETADIAARTMDKYLLFGHLLICKLVKPENVHPDLFKGANRRFKVVPWNKMQGKQLERPLSESQWGVKISKEEQRRAKRAEKLKALGYEFEAPALKAPEAKEGVPAIEEAPAAEENGAEAIETEETPAAIEAPPAAEEEEKAEEEVAENEEEAAKETPVKKAAKEKKGSATKAKKGRRSSTK